MTGYHVKADRPIFSLISDSHLLLISAGASSAAGLFILKRKRIFTAQAKTLNVFLAHSSPRLQSNFD